MHPYSIVIINAKISIYDKNVNAMIISNLINVNKLIFYRKCFD